MVSLFFLLAASLSLSAAAAPPTASGSSQREPIVGGWQPINNLSDPLVQEIAKFAVDEQNKKTQNRLRLIKVKSGETQVVAGANYRLIIIAAARALPTTAGKYEATVWVKSWENFMELTSFKPINP